MHRLKLFCQLLGVCMFVPTLPAAENVFLVGVPDYNWHAGCFGTANGNLMGFWDRHGMSGFYIGPTGDGLAPLDTDGANISIRSLWVTQAGTDGRAEAQPGHMDDYWNFYESTGADPYIAARRGEHTPDCIGDFIGLNQKKWANLNGECDGNIDGYSFVYWESNGARRVNYTPPADAGGPATDIQSGLRAWAKWRGYDTEVFTQLTDFNPHTPIGSGFTFEHLKAEINAGYPVLVFLQPTNQFSRAINGMAKANPMIHGMMIYGYQVRNTGEKYAWYRTSWASGDFISSRWASNNWQAAMPVRGVIGFHPKPKVTRITRSGGMLSLAWDGPSSEVYVQETGVTKRPHWYVVEKSLTLNPPNFQPAAPATPELSIEMPDDSSTTAFYRVRLEPR